MLNHNFFTSLAIALSLFSTKLFGQCPKIIWSDEFDGTNLNLSKWSYQTGDGCDINLCQWGNNELQWYTQDNVAVSNGTLKITAKRQTFQNRDYTSGRIRTSNKGDIKYGRIEARMKLPVGKGLWPAFWMLPTDNVYGIWPQSGEIDIMEYVGHQRSTIFGTLHYGNLWPNNQFTTKTFTTVEGGYNEDFHHYAVEWTENEIKWFIDGYWYSTKTRSNLGGFKWPFDQRFHFLLNLAVGGNLPGNPDGTAIFPQIFEIDYVRVYDLTGAAYLIGNQKVPSMAKNSAYSIANFPTGGSITWSLPAGATLVSGGGTKDIVVNWGLVGGKITATVTTPCGENKYELAVKVEPVLATAVILENIDLEAKITRTSNTGVFTDNFPTPKPNTVNNSALCAKYVRSANQQYDLITYNIAEVKNGAEFTASEKKFYIDIQTDAPIGTTILLQLENKSIAQPTNYPSGRHSRYTTVTTKQNEWERLAFAFTDQPDANLSNQAINQLILLFAPNTFNGSTFHFDNFEIYAKPVVATIDIEKEYPVQLLPNPAYETLMVIAGNDKIIKKIDVTNVLGKTVLQQNSIDYSETKVAVASLVPGIYYLNIYFNDFIKTTKVFSKK